MPGWTLIIALALALVSALAVNLHVQIRSQEEGDGLVTMWIKGGCLGGLAMIGVVAAFLLLANFVTWLH